MQLQFVANRPRIFAGAGDPGEPATLPLYAEVKAYADRSAKGQTKNICFVYPLHRSYFMYDVVFIYGHKRGPQVSWENNYNSPSIDGILRCAQPRPEA